MDESKNVWIRKKEQKDVIFTSYNLKIASRKKEAKRKLTNKKIGKAGFRE